MKYLVIKAFRDRGEIQRPGSIIHVPDSALIQLAGYIEPATCQARKVGNRTCMAPLKEGPTGFLSCSDMFCQVPFKAVMQP